VATSHDPNQCQNYLVRRCFFLTTSTLWTLSSNTSVRCASPLSAQGHPELPARSTPSTILLSPIYPNNHNSVYPVGITRPPPVQHLWNERWSVLAEITLSHQPEDRSRPAGVRLRPVGTNRGASYQQLGPPIALLAHLERLSTRAMTLDLPLAALGHPIVVDIRTRSPTSLPSSRHSRTGLPACILNH